MKSRTINAALQVARRILNLAANEWLDSNGLTWLAQAPKIKLLPETDKSAPYPLNWDEQDKFFTKLPLYLQRMALFNVKVPQTLLRKLLQIEMLFTKYLIYN